jgi:hypothetical protein
MACWDYIDYDKLLNPERKRKVRGCHSNHVGWVALQKQYKKDKIDYRLSKNKSKQDLVMKPSVCKCCGQPICNINLAEKVFNGGGSDAN